MPMKKYICLFFFLIYSLISKCQTYFPPVTGDTWSTIDPQSLGWCTEKMDTLLKYLEYKNTKAFIVLKDGNMVIEKYFGDFTKDSEWYWASAGKS
jgi:hypothetical protein